MREGFSVALLLSQEKALVPVPVEFSWNNEQHKSYSLDNIFSAAVC